MKECPSEETSRTNSEGWKGKKGREEGKEVSFDQVEVELVVSLALFTREGEKGNELFLLPLT